ncbi:twin-arginine translocase TatA/TatE family subunit [Halogranum gelatinilyticum]|uniref:twin-arginine translocase TatA/TatE family subunit n=1 Tax=Halogranum gelatinilyticum TaxID=660521 RepID=UPI000B7DA385|nr:twin-arginine translocase TatA/TatE family subunit [Halogranum gelatinilyticum]
MDTVIPLFGPIPGGPELLIILLVLVLLFGANKIPKLARSTGQAMGEFKKGREEVEDELKEMQEKGKDSVTPDTDDDDETEVAADTEADTETEKTNN